MSDNEEGFSFFGGIDIADIPESILRGKYHCELTEAKMVDVTKEPLDVELGHKMCILNFEVNKSKYVGESGKVFLHFFTSKNITQDEDGLLYLSGELMDPNTSQDIRKGIKSYKRIAKEMGFSPEAVNRGANFNDKVGQVFMVSMYADSSNQTRVSNNDPIVPADKVNSELDDLELD